MGSILSTGSSKAQYYRDQAESLRVQANQAREADEQIEAARLDKIAQEADQEALNQEAQIREVARKITES